MALDNIEVLESQRKHFINTSVVTPKALTSFHKVIDLFEESQDAQAQLTVATRSRRRAARELLNIIQDTLGHEVFLLCAFCLSITLLSSIKDTAEFLGSLQSWWAQAEVPVNLSTVTKTLFAKYGKAFPIAGRTTAQAISDVNN